MKGRNRITVTRQWFSGLLLGVILGASTCAPVRAQFPLQTMKTDGDGGYAVSFSPDGSILASSAECRGDATDVILWDTLRGHKLHTLKGHEEKVNGIEFSPDGTRCASCASDGTVRVWDTQTGRELRVFRGRSRQTIHSLVWSKDGKVIVSSGENHLLTYWDLQSGQPLGQIDEHKETVARDLSLSSNGKVLALAGEGRAIRLRDFDSGRLLGKLVAPDEGVAGIAFSPDGSALASGGSSGAVLLWNVHTGTCKHLPRAHGTSGRATSVAFSADGELLAVKSNSFIAMYDLATHTLLGTISARGYSSQIAFSADSRYIASVNGVATSIWSAKGPYRQVLTHGNSENSSPVYSPDGTLLASVTDGKAVTIWNPIEGKRLTRLESRDESIRHLAFTADNLVLATATSDEIILWDLMMGAPRTIISDLEQSVLQIAVSPDGNTLAARCNKCVEIRDMQTGLKRRALEPDSEHSDYDPSSIAFSPDGNVLAIGYEDGWVEVRNVESGGIMKAIDARAASDTVWVSFSPDAKSLFLRGQNWIKRCDPENGNVVVDFENADEIEAGCGLSPDGKVLSAVTDDAFRMWSTDTGKVLREVKGYPHGSKNISFSPNGRHMTYSRDWKEIFVIGMPQQLTTNDADLPVATFTGKWEVPGGPLTLQVSGDVVTGTFVAYGGKIEAQLLPDQTAVSGSWVQENGLTGGFALKMSTDGTRIEGSRWIGDQRENVTNYPWSGNRIED